MELMKYITVMPSEDADHNRGHKYPFVVSDLFNGDNQQLLSRFFEDDKQYDSEDEEDSK